MDYLNQVPMALMIHQMLHLMVHVAMDDIHYY